VYKRQLTRAPNAQGLNLFPWTFRYADGIALTDTTFQMHRVFGATAVPGAYSVRLTVAGQSETRPFNLKADPRVNATAADYRARFDFARRMRGSIAAVVETVNAIAELHRAVDARRAEAAGHPELVTTLRRFGDSLGVLSRRLATPRFPLGDDDPYSTSSLSELERLSFGDMNSAPNQAERTGSVEAMARARHQLEEVKRAIGAALPPVNDALRSAGMAPLPALR
jgi:hypothetical protein